MAVSAEQLNIILSARDKEFAKAMERNQKRVEHFARKSNKSLGSVSAGFKRLSLASAAFLPALSATAVVAAVRRVTEQLDEIGKKADQIGLTTDALQEFRAIAESSGVSQAKLDSSLERFSKRLGEASMGTGAAKKALDELNLSADELRRVGLDEAVMRISEEMQKVEDPTRKAALAAGLFGREGVAMINMLREGRDGMEAMRREARELGIVIDEDMIRNAEEAQTQLDLMSRVINANLSTALINLSPLIVKAAEGIATVSQAVNRFLDLRNRLSDEPLDATGLRNLVEEYEGLESELSAVTQAQAAYNANVEKYGEASEQAASWLSKLTKAEDNLQQAIARRNAEKAAEGRAVSGIEGISAETKELREQAELNKLSAEERERQRIATERMRKEAQIIADIEASGREVTAELRQDIEQIGENYEQAAISASKILTPMQAAASTTASTARSAQNATQSFEDMFGAIINGSPALQALGFDAENLRSTMSTVEASMEDAFMSMIDGTQSAGDAFKSMASEIIKELFRVLVVQQLVGSFSSGGGGILGSVFGAIGGGGAPITGQASGGSVQAGKPYITGEHGRELFVPQVNGRILSAGQTNNAMSSGGGGVTVIQNNTFGSGVSRAEVTAMLPKMVEATKAAVADAKLRGGSYGRSFG